MVSPPFLFQKNSFPALPLPSSPSFFCFQLLKTPIPLFVFSPLFPFPLLLFISRKRRCPPCSVPSWCRGERAALPLQGKVAGCVCRAWCPSLLLSRWQGMVMWVWVLTGFYEVEGRESEREKHFQKIFFFPDFACAGKKKLHRAVQNGTVHGFFFFLKKRKKTWE